MTISKTALGKIAPLYYAGRCDITTKDLELLRSTKQYADYKKANGILQAVEYTLAKIIIDLDDGLLGGGE